MAPKSALHREFIQDRIAELKSRIRMGGLQECAIRGLIYIGLARGRVDERGLNALKLIRLSDGMPRLYAEFKAMARDQFFMLLLDTEATLEAIPVLLPAGRRSAPGSLRLDKEGFGIERRAERRRS